MTYSTQKCHCLYNFSTESAHSVHIVFRYQEWLATSLCNPRYIPHVSAVSDWSDTSCCTGPLYLPGQSGEEKQIALL